MQMMRKIVYLTGTRADFGLMSETLSAIDTAPHYDLTVLVTGQHLAADYGDTAREIIASGLNHHLLPAVAMRGEDGAEMAHGVAEQMHHITDFLKAERPDLLLLLGDRGEMLAGAWAALFLGIPCLHFHGGERSGTVDDPMRQAISALCQYHAPATPQARERLLRMGEVADCIFLLGAPGLDGIRRYKPDHSIIERLALQGDGPLICVLFHPVVQDMDLAADQASTVLESIASIKGRSVVFAPNSDAGSAAIRDCYAAFRARSGAASGSDAMQFHWVTHLGRDDYLSLLASADVLLGNSSSGIIEAASLGTPTVNVGDRQAMRERNACVFDCDFDSASIRAALDMALACSGQFENLYDQGGCASRIVQCLDNLPWSSSVPKKAYSY